MDDRKTIWKYGTYLELHGQTLDNAKTYIETLIERFGKDAVIFEETDEECSHFEVRIPKIESDADYEIRKRSEAAQVARFEAVERLQYEALKKKFG